MLRPDQIDEERLGQQICMHELAPVDLVIRTGESIALVTFCFGKLPMPNFTLRMFFGPISMNKTLKVRCMPLLIESVVSAVPSPVMTKPDGVAFAEVSPDFCFCVNTRGHRCAFLLPPVGFAIITLVVCMLAAWEWGQLSGFAARSQRVWLAVLCGLLLALMLFLLPEYHHNIRQPLVEMSLWASLGWWVVALLLVLFYPGSAAIWRNSKTLRLIFGLLTIVPFFWGMLALRALAL